MKKKFIAPHIEVVKLDTRDIIATSKLDFGEGGGTGIVGAPLRNVWDDEDLFLPL